MIDCHSHLTFLKPKELLNTIQNQSEISNWVLGGYDPRDWDRQMEMVLQFPEKIKTCIGLHPWFVCSSEFDKSTSIKKWKEMFEQADFVGEIGLDFSGDTRGSKKELQIQVFEEQLSLAIGKPMVFHIVKAHGVALKIIKNYKLKGFVHSFSASIEVAHKYREHGLLLSFGPSILKESYKKTRETLKLLPLEAILVESDSPDSIDSKHYNHELFMRTFCEVAKIKNIGLKDLKVQIEKNFNSMLGS